MDESQILYFLKELGQYSVRSNAKWVYTHCPLASTRHAKGVDNHPSFGISISPNDSSMYNCFTCHAKGDLLYLLRRLGKITGKNYASLAQYLQMHNQPSLQSLEERRALQASYAKQGPREIGGQMMQLPSSIIRPPPEPVYLPEYILSEIEMPTGEVASYLRGPKRRLTNKTVDSWGLGWQPKSKRIAIPVRDLKGRLVGITSRAFFDWQKPRFLHSKGFQRDLYLFGEHKIESGQPGYLVEGHFDAIYLCQQGYRNAVAVMGTSLSPYQVEKLVSNFSQITIVPDGDKAGDEASESWRKILSPRIHTTLCKMPEGKDPDNLTDEEMVDIIGPVPQKTS